MIIIRFIQRLIEKSLLIRRLLIHHLQLRSLRSLIFDVFDGDRAGDVHNVGASHFGFGRVVYCEGLAVLNNIIKRIPPRQIRVIILKSMLQVLARAIIFIRHFQIQMPDSVGGLLG